MDTERRQDAGDKEMAKIVLDIYGSKKNPLSYVISPRGSIKFIDKDDVTEENLEKLFVNF